MNALPQHVLLIDFCGAEPQLALMRGAALSDAQRLPERGAAAGWLRALKRLLSMQGVSLGDLSAIGVVAGPGSFTGVRTGLAAAQGLAEATHLGLVAVSRLAVLARAAATPGSLAALHAGRGQVYLRTPSGENMDVAERLVDLPDVARIANGRPLAIAESRLIEPLAECKPRLVELGPEQILPLVHEALSLPGTKLPAADANYVRHESEIYRKPSPVAAANGAGS